MILSTILLAGLLKRSGWLSYSSCNSISETSILSDNISGLSKTYDISRDNGDVYIILLFS